MNVMSIMTKGRKIGLTLEKDRSFNKFNTPTGKSDMRKAIKVSKHTNISIIPPKAELSHKAPAL